MPRQSLSALVEEFSHLGRQPAIVAHRGYRREVTSYAELTRRAVQFALELRERGIRTGDRVMLWGPNGSEWVAAFWGCLLRGAVAVPMDDAATPEFAARVAADAVVKLIVASREKPAISPAVLVLEDLVSAISRPCVVDSVRTAGEPKQSIWQTFADEPLTRKHVAQILFTSGTTGEPRGVVLTHGNFLANLEPIENGFAPYRKYERWFHPLRFVTLVPLSHVFGQVMGLFLPPLLGATVVFELSANPGEILRTVKRERATALIAVPRMLDALRGALEREAEARGEQQAFARAFAAAAGQKFLRRVWRFRRIHRRLGWKFWAFICGGAALGAETENFFRRLGYAVVQGYGMTETASLISLNHPFRAAQGSIGKILPGREFRLAEDGEILVRGENVASAYWEKGAPRPALAAGEEGWLRTGDLGELDAEGNLRFRGRKKNVIVTPAGLNVYPEDLEAVLRRDAAPGGPGPALRDCVVLPLARDGNAEPCAVLLLGDAAPPAANAAAREIVHRANSALAEYQRIRQWLIWPEPDFPRTPTGKPRLAEIAARAQELLGGAAPPAARRGALDDLLRRFAGPAIPAHLERELNLTSLDRVELLSALEDRYQLELNETSFAEAKTVADVERLLRQPAAQRTPYVYPRWTQRAPVRWLRLAVYYALAWPATLLLAHPKIVGRAHLRGARGPFLLVSNHVTSRADIGLLLYALPPRVRHRLATAMLGEFLETMRRPPRDWLFAKRWAYQAGYWLLTALFNVFPLPQQSGVRESFSFAGQSADRGYSVLVFPEGAVTKDGAMAAFRGGIGLLAENLALPVIPLRLDGLWAMKCQRRRWAHFGELTVRIGAPLIFPPGTPPEEITRALEARVRGL
ncbi:MAG: AMP-binding protein [Acidobacteriia bacterium]|nr:AMP-binding protein [Terriglobia bacterium]